MSSDRDPTTRIVRLWLEDGATTLPDRVLERVLANLPATPQHRAYRPVWRFPSMPNAFKVALTAAVLVAVIATGVLVRSPQAGVGGALEQVSPSPVVCQSRAPDSEPEPQPPPAAQRPADTRCRSLHDEWQSCGRHHGVCARRLERE